jgi:phosphoadenosine phosphosulfate reductase
MDRWTQPLPSKPTNWCPHCHIPTTEAICLACGKGTDPLINTGRLRPVFRQEIELMERLTGVALLGEPQDLVLWRSGRDYFAAGRKVAQISGGSCSESPKTQILNLDMLRTLNGRGRGRRPAWSRRSPEETTQLLTEGNSLRLTHLEEEGVFFLRATRDLYPELPLVVSWSGGKDSTAASFVTRRAFPDERIIHVFADTTIELPCTYEYVRAFRETSPAVPFLIGSPARDFFALSREIGPPSRIQRWCCTTHKAAPLTEVLRAVGRGGSVLVAGGLRRTESARRQEYARVITEGKIGLQVLLSPLADWTDFDVWVWTVVSGAPVNAGYLLGLDRIGCAFCPDSRDWSDMIGVDQFGDYYQPWIDLLEEVAGDAGVLCPEDYVASGAWRNRRGGGIGRLGLARSTTYHIVSRPCEGDACGVTYELTSTFSLTVLRELLKVFGAVAGEQHADEVGHFEVKGPHGSFTVEALPRWKQVRVVFQTRSVRARLEGTLRAHLRKLQACVGCGGCAAVCPHGAIVEVGGTYRVVEGRCSHCLACIREVKAGCWAAHSLNVRQVVYGG